MRKRMLAVSVIVVALAAWRTSIYFSERSYARMDYEVEEANGRSFTVQIPKGWSKPDYSNPRESKTGFTTSSPGRDGTHFVQGTLSIEDEGNGAKIESVLADWRKDEGNGRLSATKIAGNEAWTWQSTLALIDVVGESRTFVFRGGNGHVYSAHYQLAQKGRYRLRQDYVFGRILASMKFKS